MRERNSDWCLLLPPSWEIFTRWSVGSHILCHNLLASCNTCTQHTSFTLPKKWLQRNTHLLFIEGGNSAFLKVHVVDFYVHARHFGFRGANEIFKGRSNVFAENEVWAIAFALVNELSCVKERNLPDTVILTLLSEKEHAFQTQDNILHSTSSRNLKNHKKRESERRKMKLTYLSADQASEWNVWHRTLALGKMLLAWICTDLL